MDWSIVAGAFARLLAGLVGSLIAPWVHSSLLRIDVRPARVVVGRSRSGGRWWVDT
jgi:hypothetical protein